MFCVLLSCHQIVVVFFDGLLGEPFADQSLLHHSMHGSNHHHCLASDLKSVLPSVVRSNGFGGNRFVCAEETFSRGMMDF